MSDFLENQYYDTFVNTGMCIKNESITPIFRNFVFRKYSFVQILTPYVTIAECDLPTSVDCVQNQFLASNRPSSH
jgi:hypothetical protein